MNSFAWCRAAGTSPSPQSAVRSRGSATNTAQWAVLPVGFVYGVLSTFKVGQAKLWCSGGEVRSMHFDLRLFSVHDEFIRTTPHRKSRSIFNHTVNLFGTNYQRLSIKLGWWSNLIQSTSQIKKINSKAIKALIQRHWNLEASSPSFCSRARLQWDSWGVGVGGNHPDTPGNPCEMWGPGPILAFWMVGTGRGSSFTH